MKTKWNTAWLRLAVVLSLLLAPFMGRAGIISYQGSLMTGGVPATGLFEIRFQLCDAVAGGQAKGSAVTNIVAVTNGLFTTVLDLDGSVFDGSPAWMELGVRTNGAPEPFSVLAPRQRTTSVPEAVRAETVGAAGITGVLADGSLGTNVARLDVDATFTGAMRFLNGTNTFAGTFSGNGAGISNINAAALVGEISTTNPRIMGSVKYATDIVSIEERVETDYSYPTGPPAGHVWRSLVPAKDVAGQTNWCVVRRSATVLNPPWVQPILPSGFPTVTSTEFVFGMDGSSFVVLLRGTGSTMGIEVDGADDETRISTPADVKTHYYTVNFASRARRQIVLKLSGNYQFGGLYVPATNGLWPGILPRQFRLIVMGDSFSEDTSSTGWTSRLMSLFHNLDVWSSAVGSTGYLSPGTSGRVNFQDRIMADVVANQPDYVVFAGGINDTTITTNSASAAALQESCLNSYQAIQTNLPNCRIVVLGPFWPRTPDLPMIHLVNGAISNACNFAGIGSNYVDTLADPWVTGRWNLPGSGNAVRYTLGDGTHPTGEGTWNIAYHVAAELTRRFPELAPREKTR